MELVDDPDSHSVQAGSRFALHRLGDTRYSHGLEKLGRDQSPRVRGNVAMVLGLLNDKTALNVLRGMSNDLDPAVRLQVAEAMWRLSDDWALDTLVAGTVSGFADDQILCVLALAAPRDQRVLEHVRGKLTSDYTEVALAAARAMGQLGSDAGYGVAEHGAKSKDPRQRSRAAMAFGDIGRPDAQPILSQLLHDPERPVRLAAATAILE